MSEQIAWAAGLFEGEGCISTQVSFGRVRVRFTMSITDKDVLERFVAIVGRGRITGPAWPSMATKPQWRWSSTAAADVQWLSDAFRPYLGERRLATLERCLADFNDQPAPRHHLRDRTHCKRGHEFTPENTRLDNKGRNCGPSRRCLTCERERGRRRVRRVDTRDVLADLALIEGRA